MVNSVNFKATQITNDALDAASKSTHHVTDVNSAKTDDRVSISDSARLALAIQQEAKVTPEDMERIRQLQVAIQSGNYQVDSQKVADKLFREAIRS